MTRSPLIPFLAFAAFLLSSVQDKPTTVVASKPVTVFFLRHAEKVADKNDPGLTKAGETRALALRRLLSKAGITHMFASEYKRTQATIAPLAKAIGVKVQVVSAAKPRDQMEALRKLPAGSIAVVAGHSNTIPGLLRQIGAAVRGMDRRGYIADAAHDRLFIVTLPAKRGGDGNERQGVQTIELRYGES